MLTCARNGCDVTFNKKTHNQKYCSDICCGLATNERLKIKYHENRARKLGKTRICNKCNITKLSRYNDESICSGCKAAGETSRNMSARQLMAAVV